MALRWGGVREGASVDVVVRETCFNPGPSIFTNISKYLLGFCVGGVVSFDKSLTPPLTEQMWI